MTDNPLLVEEKICLIVPCYNEAGRLDFGEYKKYSDLVRFIFVNDGSTDATADLIHSNAKKGHILPLDLETNLGKAEAVRQGILYALELEDITSYKWIGYWDGDLATPLAELENFIKYHENFAPDADAVFGSRVSRLGSGVNRSISRYIIGRLFMNIVRFLLKIRSYDSQCGAKIFTLDAARLVFSRPFVCKWIFDIETVTRLKELKVVEYPLFHWNDVKGSKISNFRVISGILADIVRLYLKCDK